ncbi:MAG: hypothetical protein HZY76_00040 [Anaerolineae bacterium]|nr:MAG: hypothetical protein HZY76_23680 [Anaerolineae bacterium]QLQ04636.1 MAG: hypothetical protein HZY76_00040 [Anaerolineae bacterium]
MVKNLSEWTAVTPDMIEKGLTERLFKHKMGRSGYRFAIPLRHRHVPQADTGAHHAHDQISPAAATAGDHGYSRFIWLLDTAAA